MYDLLLALFLTFGAPANTSVTVVCHPGQKLQPITVFRPMDVTDTTGDDGTGGDDGHLHP